ncbi:MAG TPA: DUF2089 family protein, partial [Chloroflexota bacterium]
MRPLITRDPVSGGELIVTRLECPASGIVIEGRFALGWPALLTAEQLAFVYVLLQHRGNIQKVAAAVGLAYNTARARMDDIVAALDAPAPPASRLDTLDRLAAGEIAFDEA